MRSTQPQVYNCEVCLRYLAPTGERVPYTDGAEVIVWTECARCMEKRVELEAREEARRLRKQARTEPRECELDGCTVTFVPETDWQGYCCDEHRWVAHRLLKKNRAGAAGT